MENNTVAILFPGFSSAISIPGADIAKELRVDWKDAESLAILVGLIEEVQTFALQNGGHVLEVAAALFGDLQVLRTRECSSTLPIIDFLQLINATQPLVWARSGHQWHLVYDWLYYALNDQMPCPVEVEFSLERLRKMLIAPDARIAAILSQDIFMWLEIFYNFAWKVGGVDHLASCLFVEAASVSTFAWPRPEAVAVSMHVATWATRLELKTPPPILGHLWDLYRVNGCPELRNELAILFAGLGSAIGVDGRQLAEDLLAHEVSSFREHERLQLLVYSCSGDLQRTRCLGRELEVEIRRYANDLHDDTTASQPAIYRRERSFDLIAPLLGMLLAAGDTTLSKTLLCAWKGVGDDPMLQPLFVCPTLPGGPCYVYNGQAIRVPIADMDASLSALTQAANSFYQTTVALRGNLNFRMEAVSDIGLPNTTHRASVNYEDAIGNHFGFEAISGALREISKPTGMVIIPSSREPIQSCMFKACGATFPILSSFLVPLAERKLDRVLLWHRGTLWGYREAEWLQGLFASRNIASDVIDGSAEDLDDVRRHYENDSYDALWFISHGEFEHFDVHKSSFAQLASIEEWSRWKIPDSGRRLLVLNMCDSSTAGMLGGLGDSGLAASLSSAAQAVIGNLWPVSTALSSVFSVLLADSICGAESFFRGYERWVGLRLAGPQAVTLSSDMNSRLAADLLITIDNSSEDWSPLFAWGSASFHS